MERRVVSDIVRPHVVGTNLFRESGAGERNRMLVNRRGRARRHSAERKRQCQCVAVPDELSLGEIDPGSRHANRKLR
jgi:hypothetical protein